MAPSGSESRPQLGLEADLTTTLHSKCELKKQTGEANFHYLTSSIEQKWLGSPTLFLSFIWNQDGKMNKWVCSVCYEICGLN